VRNPTNPRDILSY